MMEMFWLGLPLCCIVSCYVEVLMGGFEMVCRGIDVLVHMLRSMCRTFHVKR